MAKENSVKLFSVSHKKVTPLCLYKVFYQLTTSNHPKDVVLIYSLPISGDMHTETSVTGKDVKGPTTGLK